MPVKRRLPKQRLDVDETFRPEDHLLPLFCGFDFFNAYGGGRYRGEFDLELARRHWFEHRQFILDSFMVWPNRAGREKPWAQIEFEAAE